MTFAPLSARCRPMARPIPLAPPVTMAVFPEIENDMVCVLVRRSNARLAFFALWAARVQQFKLCVAAGYLAHFAKQIGKRLFVGQVAVGDHPELSGRFQHFGGGSDKGAAKSRIGLARSVKGRVHYHSVGLVCGTPAKRIFPVKLCARIGDIEARTRER